MDAKEGSQRVAMSTIEANCKDFVASSRCRLKDFTSPWTWGLAVALVEDVLVPQPLCRQSDPLKMAAPSCLA